MKRQLRLLLTILFTTLTITGFLGCGDTPEAISLIDNLASNPQKVGDDGIDIFGMFLNKPDNMDHKTIIVQVTGASGSQKAKFDRLHASIRNENAAIGILITLDAQNAQRNYERVRYCF